MNLNTVLQSRSFGISLVAASLVAVVMSGFTSYQLRGFNECQSGVYEQLVQASLARSEAAEQDRQSDRAESRATALLIQAVFTGASTADRLAAYETYRLSMEDVDSRRDATAREREAHPLPDPPSQACA
jgi:hypothetical protein